MPGALKIPSLFSCTIEASSGLFSPLHNIALSPLPL